MSDEPTKRRRARPGEARRWMDDLIAQPGEGCRIDWPFHQHGGYPIINRDGRPCHVSRIVCEAFHGPPPTPTSVARHGSCHDSMCLQPAHLSWGSQVDNAIDTIRDGTWRGVVMGSASFNEGQVLEIVEQIDGGVPMREVARRYGVCYQTIYNINNGRSWNWLTRRKPIDPAPFRQAFAEFIDCKAAESAAYEIATVMTERRAS